MQKALCLAVLWAGALFSGCWAAQRLLCAAGMETQATSVHVDTAAGV